MTKNKTFQCAVFLCGLSVVFGAFGAHLLENLLDYHGKIDVFKTAISFQFNHSLALLFVGFLMTNKKNNHLFWTSLFFIFGILFFSGSLYLLCLTNLSFIGLLTPLGGSFLIMGWIRLFIFFNTLPFPKS
tara:strand:- start:3618 stop:4007 length:390 start_codon:yes stop_codon:yes gene_type:complete